MQAERPVLYVGGGCLDAAPELRDFVARTGVPVAATLMGLGTFPESHELSLGMLGMHGTVVANYAINDADLLLALGVRFDDRVTGAHLSNFFWHLPIPTGHWRLVSHVDLVASSVGAAAFGI